MCMYSLPSVGSVRGSPHRSVLLDTWNLRAMPRLAAHTL